MIRTFLALDLDAAFLKMTVDFIAELRGARLPRPRWVASHALHVTVRFLGDTDEALVPALSELAHSFASTPPIEVASTSLLAFPDTKRARVLGLHLADDGALAEIAAMVERAVTGLGFPASARPFRPHLTLARFRAPADLHQLFAAQSAPRSGGRLTALTFYESKLGGPEGPVHTPLARFSLGGET